MTEPERRTYSVREAAVVLGVSHTFAYELAHRGEIPVMHLGRRMVVPIAELHAFIDNGGTRSAPADDHDAGADGAAAVAPAIALHHPSNKATSPRRMRASGDA